MDSLGELCEGSNISKQIILVCYKPESVCVRRGHVVETYYSDLCVMQFDDCDAAVRFCIRKLNKKLDDQEEGYAVYKIFQNKVIQEHFKNRYSEMEQAILETMIQEEKLARQKFEETKLELEKGRQKLKETKEKEMLETLKKKYEST